MDTAVLEKLREQDWAQIGRVLVLHVVQRTHLRAWREGMRLASLGLGKSPEDIVQEVITKVFAGDRSWDPARGELLPTLKRIVESELDHLWKSKARAHEAALPANPGRQEAQESAASDVDPHRHEPGPAELLEQDEDRATASATVDALFSAVEDEPELQAVLDAIMEGCEPRPRFLAEHIGVPVEQIHNRMRRLRLRASRQVTK